MNFRTLFEGLILSHLKSLAPGRCGSTLELVIFKLRSWIDILCISCKIIYTEVKATGPHQWLVNIVSGDGLVQSGNKPLPEPMLTKFYDGITRPQWVKD